MDGRHARGGADFRIFCPRFCRCFCPCFELAHHDPICRTMPAGADQGILGMAIVQRGKKGTYYLRKEVPKRVRDGDVEGRREIYISLSTDSLAEAKQ
ncbi:DUF6538 domain-containing protein [Rhodovulum visakhapatnamense]